jgi:hypothetical protein
LIVLSPSHTGPATRLRLPATEIADKSQMNRTTSRRGRMWSEEQNLSQQGRLCSHTGPATRLRLPATEITGKSHDRSQWIARPVEEVVGGRKSNISRSKVDGHVQNFKNAIPNRKRSQTGRTTSRAWTHHKSGMIAGSRTIGRATCPPTWRLVVPPVVRPHDRCQRSQVATIDRTIGR